MAYMQAQLAFLNRAVSACYATHLRPMGFSKPAGGSMIPVLSAAGCKVSFGIDVSYFVWLELQGPILYGNDLQATTGDRLSQPMRNSEQAQVLELSRVVEALDPDFVFRLPEGGCSYPVVQRNVRWLCEILQRYCGVLVEGDATAWADTASAVQDRCTYWDEVAHRLADPAFRDSFRKSARIAFTRRDYRRADRMLTCLAAAGERLSLVERFEQWWSIFHKR